MWISADNTQFFTFFAGIKNSELIALETLATSFRSHYDAPLWVMDQHEPIQKMVENRERIFITNTSYIENVSTDLDLARLESFFSQNSDFVRRIEVSRQYSHGPFINEALNKYRTLPYAVIMDSDVWFKNSDFLPDLNKLIQGYSDDEIFAAGYLIQGVPFDLPSGYQLDGQKHVLHKLGEWLIRHYGFQLSRGKLPGWEPNFFWINGEMFTSLNMSFKNLHLYILDTTSDQHAPYKLLGDNGPSVLFQAAFEGKTIIHIDIRKYREHAKAQATSVDSNRRERSVDWFLSGATEWPPKSDGSFEETHRESIEGSFKSRLKRFIPETLRRRLSILLKKYSPIKVIKY